MSHDRNLAMPQEARTAPRRGAREGDARAPCDREAATHRPCRKPGGYRVQDDPVRERTQVRSVAGPRFRLYPAGRARSRAKGEEIVDDWRDERGPLGDSSK